MTLFLRLRQHILRYTVLSWKLCSIIRQGLYTLHALLCACAVCRPPLPITLALVYKTQQLLLSSPSVFDTSPLWSKIRCERSACNKLSCCTILCYTAIHFHVWTSERECLDVRWYSCSFSPYFSALEFIEATDHLPLTDEPRVSDVVPVTRKGVHVLGVPIASAVDALYHLDRFVSIYIHVWI